MKTPIAFRAKSVLACAAVFASLLASGVATATTPACENARMDWQNAFIDKDIACSNQGPNSAACDFAEAQQAQAMYEVDLSCPPMDGYCSNLRDVYEQAAGERSSQCRQAGSSNDPQCRDARSNEFQQFKRLYRDCMYP